MLRIDKPERLELWQKLIEAIESYDAELPAGRVTPERPFAELAALLATFDFARPLEPVAALDAVVQGLWQFQVHTPHPRYYGLFNPASTTVGIAADALVAAFNPQLATWSHSPFAVAVEQHLVRAFGARFGYDLEQTDGTFCSAGAEANHTAVLTALLHAFPEVAEHGLQHLRSRPLLYASAEAHHSIVKAARLSGLGTAAVRAVPVDDVLQMDVAALADCIRRDRHEGGSPFLVVATAGTTNAGVVDPLDRIADLAAAERLWYHVDAAWGGAAVLLPELRSLLDGCARADSITFDAHKWLSVPMGAGLYLTRHPDVLTQTFGTAAAYMPHEHNDLGLVDPYLHSMQWSRRFIGLKVLLSLLVAGWDGYAEAIRHQVAMGDLLRQQLRADGWEVVNRTPLPVVCFADRRSREGESGAHLTAIARTVVSSGAAWISTTRLRGEQPVLRACITNYRTGPEDIAALVRILHSARRSASP